VARDFKPVHTLANPREERAEEVTMFAGTARNPLYAAIERLDKSELDKLPYGAIQLDEQGNILKFNAYESKLSNLKSEAVGGKNFFREVAPCTNVQEFYGRFRQGVAEKKMHAKFRYHFAFKQNPRDVTVTLFYSDTTHTVWVFVQPL
jgi:photoactive yellow protein